MGKRNSSVTRAWPVFGTLFDSDSTGANWLQPLIELCRRPIADSAGPTTRPGLVLDTVSQFEREVPRNFKTILGLQVDTPMRLRNCFEAPLPPPRAFLEWLFEHPQCMQWPTVREKTGTTKRLEFGSGTQRERQGLISGDLDVAARAKAELNRLGADKSQRRWWAFEGFTCVDVYIETESLVLLVEAKRTERLSSSTAWYPARNQLGRNLEVAQEQGIAKKKDFAVILCSEEPYEAKRETLEGSFPHMTGSQIESLYGHYWGNAIWRDIRDALCSELTLPDTVQVAIAQGLDRAVRPN